MKRALFTLITAASLFFAPKAHACAVCFGASDEGTRIGIISAIFFLMATIFLVLSGIIAFFIHIKRHAEKPLPAHTEFLNIS